MSGEAVNRADAAEAVLFGEIEVDSAFEANEASAEEHEAEDLFETVTDEGAGTPAAEGSADAEPEAAAVDWAAELANGVVPDEAEAGGGESDEAGSLAAVGEEEAAEPAEPEQSEAEPEGPPELTFSERVELKIPALRYANNLHRAILSPQEKERLRAADRRAAVWVPISTFLIIAVCAALSVVLAINIIGDTGTSSAARGITVAVFAVIIAACFWGLVRSQDYFDRQRPRGRVVRADLADAYEVVRDAPHLLVELGANQQVLDRVASLLPTADHLINMIVEHQANTNLPIKGHPLYNEMIRMSAEVQILIELQEERSGHRAVWDGAKWVLLGTKDGDTSLFPSLADLAVSLGVPDEALRAEEKRKAENAAKWKKPIDPNNRHVAQARVIVKE